MIILVTVLFSGQTTKRQRYTALSVQPKCKLLNAENSEYLKKIMSKGMNGKIRVCFKMAFFVVR